MPTCVGKKTGLDLTQSHMLFFKEKKVKKTRGFAETLSALWSGLSALKPV